MISLYRHCPTRTTVAFPKAVTFPTNVSILVTFNLVLLVPMCSILKYSTYFHPTHLQPLQNIHQATCFGPPGPPSGLTYEQVRLITVHFWIPNCLSIYLSGLVTAVAVFRNPNTIPFCLTTDLLLTVYKDVIIMLCATWYIKVKTDAKNRC